MTPKRSGIFFETLFKTNDMKVSIEIDCSDTDEIFTHLTVIRRQLKKAIKYLEEVKPNEQWEPFTVEDTNCYGVHSATVTDDTGPFPVKP